MRATTPPISELPRSPHPDALARNRSSWAVKRSLGLGDSSAKPLRPANPSLSTIVQKMDDFRKRRDAAPIDEHKQEVARDLRELENVHDAPPRLFAAARTGVWSALAVGDD